MQAVLIIIKIDRKYFIDMIKIMKKDNKHKLVFNII